MRFSTTMSAAESQAESPQAPMNPVPHISVCICSYKRPELLKVLLEGLARQESQGLFTYGIVIADNDHLRSSEAAVRSFTRESGVAVTYCVEPHQNIALARNKAIENAKGDFIAFIDDDECPTDNWLLTLFTACAAHGVDGVLGPVKPKFDPGTPRWVVTGKFYERSRYITGTAIDGKKGRTNNTFLSKRVFHFGEQAFRPEFLTGEDQDFFRRKVLAGYRFVWCDEAVVYEVVPPVRWKRGFMLRRALLRGAVSLKHPTFGAKDVVKSVIAVPAYVAMLPISLCLGQARFMRYLVRLFDHLGRLFALVGIKPVRGAYVTD